MKEFIQNTIDTIRDDRFGWKFKICNIITNDYLRNYLAIAAVRIKDVAEYLEDRNGINKFMVKQLNKSHDDIFEVFKL